MTNDRARRLIQSAYIYFQQLFECSDLNNEQKQVIQTWMEAVSNVMNISFGFFLFKSYDFSFQRRISMIFIMIFTLAE